MQRWVGSIFLGILAAAALSANADNRGPQFSVAAPGTVVFPQAEFGKDYDLDLRTLLKSQGEPPLKWIPSGLPGWLKVDSPNNRAYGRPTANGSYSFKISVTDANESGDINRNATIAVVSFPQWTVDKVDLGIQNEDKAFSFDLNTVVRDPSGGTLTFRATGLPGWMSIHETTGVLSGTPRRVHVGKYQGITVTALAGGNPSSREAFGEVLRTIHPPKWKQKQIAIDNATEDSHYERGLLEFAENPEGMDLSYEIVSATPPPWLSLGLKSAVLSGMPRKPNVGPVSVSIILKADFEGTDYSDTAVFSFRVIPINHPPEWLTDEIALPDAFTKVAYAQDLSKSVKDIDGDVLKFDVLSFSGPGTNWAKVDERTGLLSGTPQKENIGENTWVVRATDPGGLSDTVVVKTRVIKSNEPPYWNAAPNPTLLPDAKEDSLYEIDLTAFATDPDADPMAFSIVSGPGGPAWFQITPQGKLFGTPKFANVGPNKFRVRVTDNKSGSNVGEIHVLVVGINHAPYWVLNPIQFTVDEDKPVQLSVAPYAKDPDIPTPGDTLVFSSVEGPDWAQLSPDGVFTGTPKIANLGPNKYRVRVGDKGGLTAETEVIITVRHVNHKPYWTDNPILLPNAVEGASYTSSVAAFAKDPDLPTPGDALTITKVDGPAWLTVSPTGTVSGTPERRDVGVNEFRVRVTDLGNEFAITTLRIMVDKVNKCPRWRQNPILMSDGNEDSPYAFNLVPYATDEDGDPLEFKKLSGPAWMTVNKDGSVRGLPRAGDVGPFRPVMQVTDGFCTADTEGEGQIKALNHPPVISPTLPVFVVKERQVKRVNLDDPQYVADPDGDRLNFVLEHPGDYDWLTLSPAGELVLSPRHKHIGDHQVKFKVDDGQIAAHGILKIKVECDPRPPVWLIDPILMEASSNQAFSGSLSDKAKDLDGYRLRFEKKAGPGWLFVDAEGNLTGTPKDPDIADNTFTVTACNNACGVQLCTDAKLVIKVKEGTVEETIQVDSAVPGARSENFWVVDNSKHCDKTIKLLKRHISVYYDALKSAGINHNGVLLSADAHKHDGRPIQEPGQMMLMKSDNPSWVSDFTRRVDYAFSPGFCGNCYNSPIWSIYRFIERAPGLEIYQNGFFMTGVPVDGLIATHQRDHYKWYTKKIPVLKDWKPQDYAKHYLDFFAREKQSLRISAIAPKCGAGGTMLELSGDETSAGPENAYRIVVDKTGGRYYAMGCDFDMVATLKDHATRVIFRAYVHAKHRIRLTKIPLSPNSISVTLGGSPLPPGLWTYDAGTNEIVIYWHLIDMNTVKPGDLIRIRYRVS